jgi:hypothetical protein
MNIYGIAQSKQVSGKRIRLQPEKSFIEHHTHCGMLGKSSVLMMLLVGTGSLVGISSIYTPANVETQPQPQPQKEQTFTTIPGLTTTQSKLTPGQQSQIDQQIFRTLEDNQLINRLLPKIVERLQVTLNFRDNYSPLYKINKDVLAPESYHKAEARCPPGFRVTGGGGQISGVTGAAGEQRRSSILGDNGLVTLMPIPSSRLGMVAKMETSGEIRAYANCLGVEAVVSLKK